MTWRLRRINETRAGLADVEFGFGANPVFVGIAALITAGCPVRVRQLRDLFVRNGFHGDGGCGHRFDCYRLGCNRCGCNRSRDGRRLDNRFRVFCSARAGGLRFSRLGGNFAIGRHGACRHYGLGRVRFSQNIFSRNWIGARSNYTAQTVGCTLQFQQKFVSGR